MEMIFPDWENSILNVSSTFLNYLGEDNNHSKIKELQDELSKNYKNVVFINIDGLGLHALEKHLPETSFMRTHVKKKITSVFPSTTTNATRTLITATPPAEHGWFGWAMNFKEMGKTVELFTDMDYHTGEPVGHHYAWENLPYTAFYEKPNLRKDIEIYTVFPTYVHHDFSDNNFLFAPEDVDDFFQTIDLICKKQEKKFVYTYYSYLDTIMHMFGVSSTQARDEFVELNKQFENLVTSNKDSLFVITADHGHIDVHGMVNIYEDKKIIECLKYMPSIESRAAVFHVKSDMHEKFTLAFKKYEKDFELFPSKELIEKGVFGEFTNENYKHFLGDFVAIGKESNKLLILAKGKEFFSRGIFKGHHTGLTKGEMILPLIIAET